MRIEQPQMILADIKLPRKLESDGMAEAIRQILLTSAVLLRPESAFAVSRIAMTGPLQFALRRAWLQGRICCGFDAISRQLEIEKIGIASVQERTPAPYGKRISRLLLFSNDGAGRLYRHIEQILKAHSPRLLGCLVNMDCSDFGRLITGRDSKIKIVMVEHKDAVCEIMRAMIAAPDKLVT